jgi:hypothetical protein
VHAQIYFNQEIVFCLKKDAALLAILHQVLHFVTSGVFCLPTQDSFERFQVVPLFFKSPTFG